MKKSFLLLLILCLSAPTLFSQSDLTTFILIRHAEKGKDDPRNPSLSEEGVKRAQDLNELLSETEIAAIYSTPYKRTMETVTPLAESKGLEISEYNPRSMDFLKGIIEAHKGKTVIISGHSNTTPFVANALIGSNQYQQLNENDYSKIFVVNVTSIGTGKAFLMHY